MLKAVFFDLDGTLLNTIPDIHACINASLVKFGYPAIDEVHTTAYVGDGAKLLVERALPANCPDVDRVYEDFHTCFAADPSDRTQLYPDEMQVLRVLKERGLKLAVITNKPQDAAEAVLKKFFPEGLFDFIGGDTGMFPCKPDPSLARYAALTLHVAPAECAFVGDGEPDALVARNAGMYGISVLWGYRTRARLEEVGATVFADSFLSLQKILEKLC